MSKSNPLIRMIGLGASTTTLTGGFERKSGERSSASPRRRARSTSAAARMPSAPCWEGPEMGEFLIPEGAMPSPAPPPVDPMAAREEKIADDTRVEQSLNRFITGKQAALFEAPDAFYRAQGEDAIHAAPVATQKLDDLRN